MFNLQLLVISPPERIQVMERAVIKFSSEDCGICHKMSFYDQKVSQELGLQFIDVKKGYRYRKYARYF